MEAESVPWEIVNVGCGEDVTIADLAQLIGEVVGYQGSIVQDESFPDGAPQKLLDHRLGGRPVPRGERAALRPTGQADPNTRARAGRFPSACQR